MKHALVAIILPLAGSLLGAQTPTDRKPIASTVAPAVKIGASEFPPLRIDLDEINETRDSIGHSIALSLTISGNQLPRGTVVRQVLISGATDQNGQPIAMTVRRARNPILPGMQASVLNPSEGPLRATANTGPVALPRETTGFRHIEGTIELFVPSESLGSLVRIPNIKSHAGRLEHPLLDQRGIVFHLLGSQAALEEAEKLAGNAGSKLRTPDLVTIYGTYHREPSMMVLGTQITDKAGSLIRSKINSAVRGAGGAVLYSYELASPMPPDAQLLINLVVPEAIVSVPFRIENIALP